MLRKLFLLLMAFWLPVQAEAALAMSVGTMLPSQGHGQADVAATHGHEGMGHHDGHSAHANEEDAVQHDGQEHGTTGGCERCGLCQFVHSGVMLNAGTAMPVIPLPPVFLTLGDERFTAHIPELLQRPPLSAA